MFQRKLKVGYFVLAWLNIYATAYYGQYLFFYMREEYGFSNGDNLLLAAMGGFVYIFFSLFAGRVAQKRGYYFALKTGFVVMGTALVAGSMPHQFSVAAQFVIFIGWTIGNSFTWPALEALVSEGEDRKGLPAMVGLYNVVWASGAAVTYFTGGALLSTLGRPSLFWMTAIVHGAQFAILLWLERQARVLGAAHVPAAAGNIDPHDIGVAPERKRAFLRLAWLANPFAYIAMNTVIPLIPHVAAKLELTTTLAGFVCSVWLFARLFAFAGLWWWPGWHYKFRWLAGAYAVMVGCFAVLLLVENLAVVVIAQLAFGLAVGLIYYSSLFYAMDAGDTKGEHGGVHEAFIGVGLCLGPATGTVALRMAPGTPNAGILAVSALLVIGLAALLWFGGRARQKQAGWPENR